MIETVETEQGSVIVGTITTFAAKNAQLRQKKDEAFNDAFTVEALRAGGHADPQAVADALGAFTDYPKVHQAAMRVNGLRVPAKGETEAGEAPAAGSTSTGSTDS